MNTFLPSPFFKTSAKILDYRRLGKQRLEADQILNIVTGKATSKAWIHHPAVLMWVGYDVALTIYRNTMIEEWVERGYKNTMLILKTTGLFKAPDWYQDDRLHSSHRAALLAKDFDFYSKFGWQEEARLEYYWPKRYSRGVAGSSP